MFSLYHSLQIVPTDMGEDILEAAPFKDTINDNIIG